MTAEEEAVGVRDTSHGHVQNLEAVVACPTLLLVCGMLCGVWCRHDAELLKRYYMLSKRTRGIYKQGQASVEGFTVEPLFVRYGIWIGMWDNIIVENVECGMGFGT